MLCRWISSLAISLAALTALTGPALSQEAAPASDTRTGYLFVTGITTDAATITRYTRTLPPIYQKFGGIYLAVGSIGRGVTVLEGKLDAQSVILAKFTTPSGPNEFWWSPEYRASAEIRQGAGRFNVIKLLGTPVDSLAPEGKPAYLISIAEIKDRAKLKPYAESAMPLVRAAGAKFVAVNNRKDIELLEGEFGNLTVTVLQFPSMAALTRFYEDPAYQKIIPIRQSAGTYTVLAADGVTQGPRN